MPRTLIAPILAILPELVSLGKALLQQDEDAERRAYLLLKYKAERAALKKARPKK